MSYEHFSLEYYTKAIAKKIKSLFNPFIKGLSASGKTITYTKGDGTTGTITTQDTTYSAATTSSDGLMSAADKVKLDGITEGVTLSRVYPVGSVWMTTNSNANPATLFGGTWQQIGRPLIIESANAKAVYYFERTA